MREKLKWLLWVVTILVMMASFCKSRSAEKYCYADEDYPYIFFGTKTSYELIRQKKTYQPIPKCVPVKLWMLSRHGTRYPGKNKIEDMKMATNLRDKIVQNYEENYGDLCQKDAQNFKKWTFNLTTDLSNELTSQGQEDLRLHAARLKDSFPTLFNVPFTGKQFQFQTTTEKRTVDSAIAFAEGLFGSRAVEIPPPAQNDALLHASQGCSKWEERNHDPNTFNEWSLFKNGSYVKDVVFHVSQRLGFKYNLSIDDVISMYQICIYEKAWYIHSRPAFCAPFSPDDLKVMEFLDDLEHYYKYGYASEMNAKLACPLVKDMIQKFSKVASKNNLTDTDPPVTLYFAHTATILQLLTALEIKKDEQRLTHDKFESMMKRDWRMSVVDPFGSNFVAVFYKCEEGVEDNVIFHLNEDIVPYSGCRVGLCSWNLILNKFQSFIDPSTCNLDFCNSPNAASSTFSISTTKRLFSLFIGLLLVFAKL